MTSKKSVVKFLNSFLKAGEIADSSKNGVQVDGKNEIKKIALGVSASLELIKRAVEKKADMIIVHHGLIWSEPFRISGPAKEKIFLLLKHDVNFLAYHLPLDLHPRVGHNARIMKMLGAAGARPFGDYKGLKIGFRGILPRPLSTVKIASLLSEKLSSECLVFNFGPRKVKTLAVVSGGADKMFSQAAEEKLDLYVTGEVSEPVQETARENKINFISAGHYNSEKPGLWALAESLEKKFKVKTEFIDVPNPV